MHNILEVDGLNLSLKLTGGDLHALTDISFSLERGETLGIVGESGSGKSLTVMALMGLLPKVAQVDARTMRFENTNLVSAGETEMAGLRGDRMAMIFQEPMTSLNPVYTIGRQMTEVLIRHRGVSMAEARKKAIDLLDQVGITAAASRLSQYPHQLSGGLRQRVMIAMSLMCDPELLIADEPTTALDVTVQAQILKLLSDLQKERDMAMILITHDLGVVSHVADKVAVMYAGQMIETGAADKLFASPSHPYTNALLDAIPGTDQSSGSSRLKAIPGSIPSLFTNQVGCRFAPRCEFAVDACKKGTIAWKKLADGHQSRCILESTPHSVPSESTAASPPKVVKGSFTEPALEARGVSKIYNIKPNLLAKPKELWALRDISLTLNKGEILALVGESGCGKSTLAKTLLGLQDPTVGDILLNGEIKDNSDAKAMSRLVQPIFQDPYSSLNPRMTIGETIRRPLKLHGIGTSSKQVAQVEELMEKVGLRRQFYHNFPNQLSGGQRQRVAIARALVLEPEIIICDEPTSALDVSVQAQILNLLSDLRDTLGLTYLLITHDMAVVEHLATRVAVMYLGRIVEEGPTMQIMRNPVHPYTKSLVASVLTAGEESDLANVDLGTSYPNPIDPPSGCAFHPRCTEAEAVCKTQAPVFCRSGTSGFACHVAAQKQDGIQHEESA